MEEADFERRSRLVEALIFATALAFALLTVLTRPFEIFDALLHGSPWFCLVWVFPWAVAFIGTRRRARLVAHRWPQPRVHEAHADQQGYRGHDCDTALVELRYGVPRLVFWWVVGLRALAWLFIPGTLMVALGMMVAPFGLLGVPTLAVVVYLASFVEAVISADPLTETGMRRLQIVASAGGFYTVVVTAPLVFLGLGLHLGTTLHLLGVMSAGVIMLVLASYASAVEAILRARGLKAADGLS